MWIEICLVMTHITTASMREPHQVAIDRRHICITARCCLKQRNPRALCYCTMCPAAGTKSLWPCAMNLRCHCLCSGCFEERDQVCYHCQFQSNSGASFISEYNQNTSGWIKSPFAKRHFADDESKSNWVGTGDQCIYLVAETVKAT